MVLVVVVVVLCPPGLVLPALLEVLITCWYDSSTVPVIGLLTLLWITTAGFFFFNSLVSWYWKLSKYSFFLCFEIIVSSTFGRGGAFFLAPWSLSKSISFSVPVFDSYSLNYGL